MAFVRREIDERSLPRRRTKTFDVCWIHVDSEVDPIEQDLDQLSERPHRVMIGGCLELFEHLEGSSAQLTLLRGIPLREIVDELTDSGRTHDIRADPLRGFHRRSDHAASLAAESAHDGVDEPAHQCLFGESGVVREEFGQIEWISRAKAHRAHGSEQVGNSPTCGW
ncbi:MAG: hypothetical protein QM784_37750 [Polyangiaceae bacterium]